MAITPSGKISLQDLVNEFGGAAPHKLSEYYRNGPYVGSGNTSVPISGAIKLSDFYGATAQVTVTVSQANAYLTSATALRYHGYIIDNGASVVKEANNGFEANNSITAEGGSRTPTTLNGATIRGIYDKADDPSIITTSFCVVLSGTRAKSFFTSVTPQGGSKLNTSSAIHFQAGGNTAWVWESGTDSYISGWDGSGNRTAIFI